ncbi:hypothetical protein EGR_10846 [Echinococcus granulosus]|uniref:PDZ domain-containing protein n=1 Tax=Echinococcus granulosus TaxID=6210 RepID=W6TZN4_ECHGR|nr:hypothetical protein EGR_10846 [Echinococcus granulosus]EUB54295.1 hypothetical protein EGR_10846 [Echinococcus granulosus]
MSRHFMHSAKGTDSLQQSLEVRSVRRRLDGRNVAVDLRRRRCSPRSTSCIGHHNVVGVVRKAPKNQPCQLWKWLVTEKIFDHNVSDELLQINGFMTAGMSYRRAVEIIRAGGNLVRPAALSPLPLPALSFARFHPLPPIPSSAPVVPQPPPAPPLPPPYLRSLQFFAPSSVHKSSIGSHPLLSSASAAAVASTALPEWGNEDASGFPLLSTTFPPPVSLLLSPPPTITEI